jgi:flagellar biosynthesis protein FlhG
MKDQAESLRLQLKRQDSTSKTKAIAVVSGKGGVGKSNFSLNFSISLSRKGFKVLLFDMDIGMGNLDILMGKSSDKSIVDYLSGDSLLHEVIIDGPEGISFIAGGTGLTQLVHIDADKLNAFTDDLHSQLEQYDYLIFDMGAGINEDSLRVLLSVHEIFVITTPEPTSLTDAYATMKFVHLQDSKLPFFLVVNRAQTEKEGKETLSRLSEVMKKFLGRESISLGVLPDDRTIQQAVRRQIPFISYNPKSAAAKALEDITNHYTMRVIQGSPAHIRTSFVTKFKSFLFER